MNLNFTILHIIFGITIFFAKKACFCKKKRHATVVFCIFLKQKLPSQSHIGTANYKACKDIV
jgi:hypothetical protein